MEFRWLFWLISAINFLIGGWGLFVIAFTELIDPHSADSIEFRTENPAVETALWAMLFLLNGFLVGFFTG